MREWDAVFFDWDGTVVDTHPLYWDATLTVGERCGLQFPESIRWDSRFRSMTPLQFFTHHFAASGAEHADAKILALRALRSTIDLILSEMICRVTLFPHVVEILKDARGHVETVGIVTSSPRRIIDATLAHLSLRKYFDLIITADDVKKHKPHPEPYCVAKRSARARHALVVENTPTGIASGKGSLATVIGIASSHTKAELLDAGAHYAAEDHETLRWLLIASYLGALG